ncbi:MAG: ABC transporter ATP-binding protein [Myxococcales bacterium]|nr:ABC transporter ATP-binding protein [Myxococcales bacterium]
MAEGARKTDWQLVRGVWPYLLRHKGWLWIIALATPLGVLAELAQPVLLKEAIDGYIAHGDVGGLARVTGLFIAVVVGGFLIQNVGLFGLQMVGLRTLAALRHDLFRHVMGQRARFFDQRTTGDLMTRTTTDVEAIYESLAWGAVGLITDGLFILGTLIVMLTLDWQLTLVAFAIGPVIVWVVNLCRRRLRTLFGEIRRSLSVLNGYFTEQINGMQVVQLYGAEPRAREEFRRQAYNYANTYRKANWWDAGLYAVMDGMSALAIGVMLAFGAWQFGLGTRGITLGLLVAFIDYLAKVFVPIREFSGRLAMLQSAIAALERVMGLLESNERIEPGVLPLPEVEGRIEFRGVDFAYGPERPKVLHDVNFTVQPGEAVAIVGATGSGKTTIGKLLTRMYDGYEGSIRLDGRELREVQLDDVRRGVTVVHQDPYLFDGTVAENISLWEEGIDRARVEEAARLARADSFVGHFADGYDHPITERGGNLSVGQKQLLSIARALARPAPIVILDEATASVDSLTERLIDEAVEELLARRTVLVIAHRLSTITKADRILVLHHGRLVEQGTHEELLALGGRYKLLVETGFAL